MHAAALAILPTLLLVGACRPAAPTRAPSSDTDTAAAPVQSADATFAALAERLLVEHWQRNPGAAVEAGRHEHDGRLRDVSPEGLQREIAALQAARRDLDAIDPSQLSARARVEHATLAIAIRGALFELVTRKSPQQNPMFYLADLNLTPYIARSYAPIETRAQAIVAIANATATHLSHAQTQLAEHLPRPWVDTALLQVRGTIAFVKKDVPTAMEGLGGEPKRALDAALTSMRTALTEYEAFLQSRLGLANDDFALGPEQFVQMLRETQGIDVDLARLREIGEADLARNRAAIEQAAAQIDAARPVAQVIAKVNAEKPKANAVLATAYEQATAMRAFLLDADLVSIPSEDLATVKESPPFMRWNAAFLDPAGPFETASLPSFYYISPPDPKWPKAQQKAYIPGTTDLLFITIHEVWPGHFLHGLHVRAQPSDVLKAFWNYTTGEGWAHYAEEMMWNAGVSDDPKVHIGQLQNALLRNVRFLSAIGLHTGGMTVKESEAMFREQAFQDEANARQQAARGTFDPMYLAYTLGKLVIMKLHDDWQAARKAAGKPVTLKAFHDELLSYGAAPLPAIRAAMLGPKAGPLL